MNKCKLLNDLDCYQYFVGVQIFLCHCCVNINIMKIISVTQICLQVSDLDWCRAVYNLVSHMRDASSMISIKAVSDYLSDQNGLVRW